MNSICVILANKNETSLKNLGIFNLCILRIAAVLLVLLLALVCNASAATIVVDTDGSGNYTTIQAAINNALDNDTILVNSSTYYENVEVNKSVILQGQDTGSGAPVVDGNGSGNAITINADGVTIEQFYLINCSYWLSAGIKVNSDNNIIKNNTASENYFGINVFYSNNNSLINNNIFSNTYGVSLDDSINNSLNANNVSFNLLSGIILKNSNDNQLIGNAISDNEFGIDLFYSTNNGLQNNNVSSNGYHGIHLEHSGSNILSNNTMTGNLYNFMLEGDSDSEFNNQIDTTNLVNDQTIYYIKNATDTVFSSSDIGTIFCINCINITIENMNLSNNGAGIFFYNTTQSKVNNVNTSNNSIGIALHSSSSNTINTNNVNLNEYGIVIISGNNNTLNNNIASYNSYWGIGIGYCNNNILKNNYASENEIGFLLYFSDNTTFINNTANSNYCGIYLDSSSNNIVYNNNIKSNNYVGFYLTSSSDNTIYNNYFNNTNNVEDDGNNIWNITKTAGTNIIGGPWLGGNYWSDYAGADIDGDFIGDTLLPYNSSTNITFGGDYMPLLLPFPITTVIPENVPSPYTVVGIVNATGDPNIHSTSMNSPGIFYYNPDDLSGNEQMNISIASDLTIAPGALTYQTQAWTDGLGDSYVAWMGKKHAVINSNATNWIITEKLVDEGDNDTHGLNVNDILTLPKGWSITLKAVNTVEKKATISLSKDGVEKDNLVINQSDFFIYQEDLGGLVPTEVMNFTVINVTTNFMNISNIDLVSTDILELENGDTTTLSGYSISTTTTTITIDNNIKISLNKSSTSDILSGQFSITTNSDGTVIELVKVLTEPGIYEISGTVNATGTTLYASSENCPGILYYGLEDRAGDESLSMPLYSNLTIPPGELNYTTRSWLDSDTGLTYVGWMGEKYAVIESGDSKWNITEKLTDENENDVHLVRVGESLVLGERYAITVLKIDVNGSEARLSLSRDGIEINNSDVTEGSNYIFESDLGGSGNTEVLNLTVDAVFTGMATELVKFIDIDLISTKVIELNNNDFSQFTGYLVKTNSSSITVTNLGDIELSIDDTTGILSNGFAVRVNENGSQAGFVKLIQITAPSVTINPVTDPTNIPSQVITGTFAESGSGISSIKVNGIIADLSGTTYSANVTLSEGLNTIDVVIIDNTTSTSSNSTTIYLDTIEPVITIDPITTPTNVSYQVINGTFNESGSGIASVIINGVNATLAGNTYSANISLTTEGTNAINVTATDNASNIGLNSTIILRDTTAPVVLIETVTTPTNVSYQVINGTFTESGSGIASVIINGVTADIVGNSYTANITLSIEGYNPVNVKALDNASNSGTQSTSILRDTLGPLISAVSNGTASNNSVTIYWNTNEPSDSMVKFGPDNNLSNLTSIEYSATLSINHSIVLTGLDNSTQYYYVVNSTDQVKNSNQTAISNFTTTNTPDNSSPVIYDEYLNKTTNVNIGETLTVSVNVSDNIGVTMVTANSNPLIRLNTTHWNGTLTADSTKTVTIVAYDATGNSDGKNLLYTLYEKKSNPPSGGGGGGGSGNSGEEFENIICSETDRQYVSKDSEISYTYELGCNIIEHINFTGLTSSNTIAAKVEVLNYTSSLVNHTPPNIVYKNLNIFVGNYGWATNTNINNPSIVFMVEKSWINEHNIDISTITMYRYNDEKWNPLTTRQIREEANSLYFKADTPGFSSFAISGQKVRENSEPTISTPTSGPTTQSTPLPSADEKASRSSNGLGILVSFVGLCSISIAAYLKRDEISQWWHMRKI
ncbi:MAG: NosD domain-containing protein [Methanosarcinales archaeon]|nr:NosD domain-containing protein [Methanosarcinales archaeon]